MVLDGCEGVLGWVCDVLGWLLDGFGMICGAGLGWFWGCFGMGLRVFWDGFEMFWDGFWMVLVGFGAPKAWF